MAKVVEKIMPTKPLIPKRQRVCAYARVSSGKDEMLHSLSAQISYYSEYIQSRHDWIYAGVYADSAVTGTREAREQFQNMLTECRKGNIDMIITKSITRFARNTVVLLNTVRELKQLGVDVWFEKENIHSNSGDGELMLSILASFSQAESLSVSENCKWRIRNDFKDGIPTGTSVYGYFTNKRQLTVNEAEAAVVRRIFEMYADGSGSQTIANILNDEGIPSPGGKQWRYGAVMEILKNEKYIGDLMLQKYYCEDHISKHSNRNKGELDRYYVKGHHEPIVSREMFDSVQSIIAERAPHLLSYDYDFKGVIFCDNCGCKYYRKKVHTETPYERFVWKCSTYTYKGKNHCDSKQIPDDVLRELVNSVGGEITKITVCKGNTVKFNLNDGSEVMRHWETDRHWTDEMKARNYENQRRRYI